MGSDESTQDLEDRRMIANGVAGQAFEGIDRAQADVERRRAQLLDGSAETLVDESLFGELLLFLFGA